MPEAFSPIRLLAQAALGAGLGLVLVAGLALLRVSPLSVSVPPHLLAAIGSALVVLAFALRRRWRRALDATAAERQPPRPPRFPTSGSPPIDPPPAP